MKNLMLQGVSLIVGVEVLTMLMHRRSAVAAVSGIATAALLLAVGRLMASARAGPAPETAGPVIQTDRLRRWRSSTETLIHWSEATRMDWDRHWRPVLARQFEAITGQRRAKDPAAFDATGQMLFGAALWGWVDPRAVADAGRRDPGPGRDVLAEILQKLERQ